MKSKTSFQVFFLKEHRKNSLKSIVFPWESVFTATVFWLQGHRTTPNAHCALVDELHLENALDDLLLHPPQAHQRLLWVEERDGAVIKVKLIMMVRMNQQWRWWPSWFDDIAAHPSGWRRGMGCAGWGRGTLLGGKLLKAILCETENKDYSGIIKKFILNSKILRYAGNRVENFWAGEQLAFPMMQFCPLRII